MLEVGETFTTTWLKVIHGQGQQMTSVPYQDYFCWVGRETLIN